MADMAYREVYTMNSIEVRKLLIKTYQDTGSISETAYRASAGKPFAFCLSVRYNVLGWAVTLIFAKGAAICGC